MIIFRPHRLTLIDALNESKEFKTVIGMKRYIVKLWTMTDSRTGKKVKLIKYRDIVIDNRESIYDPRCEWRDTRYVCTKQIGDDHFAIPQCIGMCATRYGEYSEVINK